MLKNAVLKNNRFGIKSLPSILPTVLFSKSASGRL